MKAATEADIERWKRGDGIDESTMGPARLVRVSPDVRRIRELLGLSQEEFAARFRLSLRTVQEWEQQRRVPDGPARVLLRIIELQQEAAARALAAPEEDTKQSSRPSVPSSSFPVPPSFPASATIQPSSPVTPPGGPHAQPQQARVAR